MMAIFLMEMVEIKHVKKKMDLIVIIMQINQAFDIPYEVMELETIILSKNVTMEIMLVWMDEAGIVLLRKIISESQINWVLTFAKLFI